MNNINVRAIERCLDKLLLNRDFGVERYDMNYVEDFHHIMRENYGITDLENNNNDSFNGLLKELSPANGNLKHVKDVTNLLLNLELSVDKYEPKHASLMIKEGKWQYHKEASATWDKIKGFKKKDTEKAGVDIINEFQKELSLNTGGLPAKQYSEVPKDIFWTREESGDQWTPLIGDLMNQGVLTKQSDVLTLGPRWLSEIKFFRYNLLLRRTIGLDLFSDDEELIKVGDFHNMPFEDSSFDMVYQKNAFDKAHDIRKVLDECVRVLRVGGVLISDLTLDYVYGVSELTRTVITSNEWYTKYLGDHVKEILLSKEYPANFDWARKVGLYAVRIQK